MANTNVSESLRMLSAVILDAADDIDAGVLRYESGFLVVTIDNRVINGVKALSTTGGPVINRSIRIDADLLIVPEKLG